MTTALPGTGNDPLTQAVLGLTNGTLPLYPAGTRQCNARGMTELGRYAVQKLMEKKFIIDIDHAELSIKSDMIALAEMSDAERSEEHTSELQSLMRISYAVFCLKKKNKQKQN